MMNHHLRFVCWSGLALLCLASCVSLKEVRCNSRYADSAGYDDARKGQAGKPSLRDGQICEEGYTYGQFQKDYAAGFSRGVSEDCVEGVARRVGQEDGDSGREDSPGLERMSVCRELPAYASLATAYREAFQLAFCSVGRAQAAADRDAEGFEARSPETVFKACGAELGSLAEVYHRRFDEALRRQCTPARAYALGTADFKSGSDQLAGTRRLEACPKEDQMALLQAYRGGFNDASRAAAEQKQAQLADEAAREDKEARARWEQQRAARMSQRTIKVKDQELFAQCLIELGQAHVTVANPGKESVSLSSPWSIRFLNDAQVFIRSETTMQSMLIFGGQSQDFRAPAPLDARYCIADVPGSP